MVRLLDSSDRAVGERWHSMILETIRQNYPQLTKSQKRLADHISNHYRQTAFLTASQLARRLDLNEATVIRFAQRLGYRGYPELIQHVRELVQQELTPPATELGDDPNLMQGVLNTELDGAQRLVSHLSPSLAQEVVRLILGAERVYIIGQGIASSMAQLLSYSLRYMGIRASSPPSDSPGLAMVVDELAPASLLIGISAQGEGVEIANTIRLAEQKGARTVAITCSSTAPCALAAEVALVCPLADHLPVQSITGIAIMIDALIQSLATLDPQGLAAHKTAMDRAQLYIEGTQRP